MYMYLKIVSTLTTKLCKNGCDRTNALVQNATIENTVNLPTLYHCEVHKNYASVSYLYTLGPIKRRSSQTLLTLNRSEQSEC